MNLPTNEALIVGGIVGVVAGFVATFLPTRVVYIGLGILVFVIIYINVARPGV